MVDYVKRRKTFATDYGLKTELIIAQNTYANFSPFFDTTFIKSVELYQVFI